MNDEKYWKYNLRPLKKQVTITPIRKRSRKERKNARSRKDSGSD